MKGRKTQIVPEGRCQETCSENRRKESENNFPKQRMADFTCGGWKPYGVEVRQKGTIRPADFNGIKVGYCAIGTLLHLCLFNRIKTCFA